LLAVIWRRWKKPKFKTDLLLFAKYTSMLEIFSFLKLNLAILFAVFIPGWVVLHYFFKKELLGWLEKIVISSGLSLFIINFFFVFFDKFGMNFSQSALFFTSIFILLFLFAFFPKNSARIQKFFGKENQGTLDQTKKFEHGSAFWIILFMTIIFRLFYLSDKTVPSSTDLGHHMYWAKSIVTFDRLPDYGMPDFIIGEHVIFGLVSYLSGWDLVSAWPMSLLFVFNIFSLLAFYLFAQKASAFLGKKNSQQIALLALLVGGALYAFSSPQTSFVSGGVIGNIIGNFFIPLVLFLLLSAFEEKNSRLALLAIFTFAGLVYTHHLSSYILLFTFIFFFGFLWLNDFFQLFLKKKHFLFFCQSFFKTFFSPTILLTIFLLLTFIFFAQPPSYLNQSAIDVAVGAPSKGTRTGYDWLAIQQTTGDWRFFNGIIGFILLFGVAILNQLSFKKIKTWKEKFPFFSKETLLFPVLLALAWGTAIFLMSWAPEWLKTDIPSRRIVSYFTWPVSFFASVGLFFVFALIKKSFPQKVCFLLFFFLLGAGVLSSNRESQFYFLSNTDNSEAYQTFSAARYLTKISTPEEKILKDHIYLKGDTWVKLFLMRGYNEPLSRSNLSRYDDPTKPRETCTRDIIANPDNETGGKCLAVTSVKYVLLKKNNGDETFEKSPHWSKIFSNEKTVIFFLNSHVEN